MENWRIVRRPSSQEKDGKSTIHNLGILFIAVVASSAIFRLTAVVSVQWPKNCKLIKKTFISAHLLFFNNNRCGWTIYSEDLDGFIQKCEADNEYSRAAAVAVFCLQLNTALQACIRSY